jgi:hypothetical protein
MHATYAFLISVPESFSLKGKAEHAAKTFERDYANTDNTDENNWYEICGIVTKDGECHNFLERSKDWRGRETIMDDFVKGKSKEEIWDYLIDFSFDSLKSDLSMRLGLWKEDPPQNPVPSCKKELPIYLDSRIEETIKSGRVWWMNPEKLKELSKKDADTMQKEVESHIKQLYTIRNCICSSRFGLFSRTMTTPYEYRCFDLRDAAETEKTQDVVLLVDIHT